MEKIDTRDLKIWKVEGVFELPFFTLALSRIARNKSKTFSARYSVKATLLI